MKRKIDPQLILSFGVLLISLAAVYVSIRQANIMNEQTEILLEQTKANAWPSLSLGLRRSFELNKENNYRINEYAISLTNKGTGPAIIKAVQVLVDSQAVKNWKEVNNLIKLPANIERVYSNSYVSQRILSAGEQVTILNLEINQPLMEWFFQHGHKISFEICYQSVFKDSYIVKREGFQSNLERSINKETDGCIFEEEDLFIE